MKKTITMFLFLFSISTIFSQNIEQIKYRQMVTVPGGKFTATYFSAITNNTTQEDSTISTFQIGKYEVTYELWYTVRTWGESNGYSFGYVGREGSWRNLEIPPYRRDRLLGENNGSAPSEKKYEPVTRINWPDAIAWCNAYSEMTGFTPVYVIAGTNVPYKSSLGEDQIEVARTIQCLWDADGYRLPTLIEWKYAASYNGDTFLPADYLSGANGPYTNPNEVDRVAYIGDDNGQTHPVGEKAPNYLGLFDMSGNVWELLWSEIPAGKIRRISAKSTGGGFFNAPYAGQVGYSGPGISFDDASQYPAMGFRVAR